MTLEVALRYGGSICAEPVTEGWRLTCADPDGEIAVIYLSACEARQLASKMSSPPERQATP